VIVAPAGVGVVAGVLLVPRLVRRFPREAIIDWALAGAGGVLLVLALSRVLLGLLMGTVPTTVETVFAGGLAAILGVCNACVLVPAQTILQERSHENVRARVLRHLLHDHQHGRVHPHLLRGSGSRPVWGGQVLSVVALLLVFVGLRSMGQRRSDEAVRWTRIRTRHRQGPEAFDPSPIG
jgi:hypothetical protein